MATPYIDLCRVIKRAGSTTFPSRRPNHNLLVREATNAGVRIAHAAKQQSTTSSDEYLGITIEIAGWPQSTPGRWQNSNGGGFNRRSSTDER